MSAETSVRLAVMGALAASGDGMRAVDLLDRLAQAGSDGAVVRPVIDRLRVERLVAGAEGHLALTESGIAVLLDLFVALERALDPSDPSPVTESCPSVPWLTTVQTTWIDAVSINYAVDPAALAAILPAPLEPEIFKGTAWVQVLMSSLRDLRPQGMPALFGVCFYQVSYRAAVQYRSGDGSMRRAGYFVRSETNHPVMRAVGNTLSEFKFHAFGEADMVMVRDGPLLTVGVDPVVGFAGGKLFGMFDTTPLPGPPEGSVWSSVEELHDPLVECYDALGVDSEGGFLYVLTIDRGPWNARFVHAKNLYCEYFDSGPLGGASSRLDSVLHIAECPYRWRPLRREPLPD